MTKACNNYKEDVKGHKNSRTHHTSSVGFFAEKREARHTKKDTLIKGSLFNEPLETIPEDSGNGSRPRA